MRTTPSAICSGLYGGKPLRSYFAGVNSAAMTAPQIASTIATISSRDTKRPKSERWDSGSDACMNRRRRVEVCGRFSERTTRNLGARLNCERYLKIDLCAHFYAAVHSRSIGTRLDRIPVAFIRDIIDIQLKGDASAGDPGHVTATDREQGVAWNNPLVLRIDEARRNRIRTCREREPRKLRDAIGHGKVGEPFRRIFGHQSVDQRLQRGVLHRFEPLYRAVDGPLTIDVVAHRRLHSLIEEIAVVLEDLGHRVGDGVCTGDFEIGSANRKTFEIRIAYADLLLPRYGRRQDHVQIGGGGRGRGAGFQPFHVTRKQGRRWPDVVKHAVRRSLYVRRVGRYPVELLVSRLPQT